MSSANKQTRKDINRFKGSASSRLDPFESTLVGSATAAFGEGGLDMVLTAANEVQSARVSFGDNLTYLIDQMLSVEFALKVTSADLTNIQIVFGLTGAGNADPTAIDPYAYFRLNGSFALLLAARSGTTSTVDIASGITMTNGAFYRFKIDFATGVKTQAPPFQSVGGKANLYYYAGRDALRHVGQQNPFDLSGYTGGLQPYVQIQKTAATNAGRVTIDEVCVATQSPV